MAKDVSNKSISNGNTGSTSPSISDQQKVPPLRIVLNTSGNQKSSSSAAAVSSNQSQDLKASDRPQNAKTETVIKTGGRVRIKLGTNKQQVGKSINSNDQPTNSIKGQVDDSQKQKGSIADRQDNINQKEEINASYNHLRRITRRSQRSVQTVSNEDEESISSMTSTDENQNTTCNNNSDTVDTDAVASNQSNAASSATTSLTNQPTTTSNLANSETPRRYKRRKGETSESQSYDIDGPFNVRSYKLPVQNSFELYKNIRKQVDKKLRNLISVHPKTPYGFRDYMLTRGAYILDGNKLGNGTNLYMNEDGGLRSAPVGKYHALKQNHVNYSVPSRAKVPLNIPMNSPLYNLFIEQEKERYRLLMQHIKEREKLTLSAEQEMMRVHNQAALAAANQLEPFSVCTMLKHQEIYNYLDSDGFAILSSDDAQMQDGELKRDEVRTRQRHHEQITVPPPARKNSNTEEPSTVNNSQKDGKTTKPSETVEDSPGTDLRPPKDEPSKSNDDDEDKSEEKKTEPATEPVVATSTGELEDSTKDSEKAPELETKVKDSSADMIVDEIGGDSSESVSKTMPKEEVPEANKDADSSNQAKAESESLADTRKEAVIGKPEASKDEPKPDNENPDEKPESGEAPSGVDQEEGQSKVAIPEKSVENDTQIPMEEEDGEDESEVRVERVLSDDDRRAYNKEIFLSQLQDIDDKWDKIRGEMLIRHRNEAESLYAVQKLEWEWKTKEIGACDVRTTPIIDDTLVPKLDIHSQDY